MLLPNTKLATTEQVAKYYKVEKEAIRQTFVRNKEELSSDGAKTISGIELRDMKSLSGLKSRAGNLTIFTKRAILRIGMLLRDSLIAKEIRTQLLNTLENSTDKEKIHEITKEKDLLLNVIDATDNIGKALALNELKQYYDRNKKQLENALDNQSKLKNSKKTYINQADFGARFNRKIGAKNIGKLFQIVGLAKKTYHRTTPYEQYVPKYAMNVVDNEISKKYDVAYVWAYDFCIQFIDKWLKDNGKYDIFYSLTEKDKLNDYINELYDEIVLKTEA